MLPLVSLVFALCHPFFHLFHHVFPSDCLQVEDDLPPEVAPTQPGLSWAAASLAGKENKAAGCKHCSGLLRVWSCAAMGWEAAPCSLEHPSAAVPCSLRPPRAQNYAPSGMHSSGVGLPGVGCKQRS